MWVLRAHVICRVAGIELYSEAKGTDQRYIQVTWAGNSSCKLKQWLKVDDFDKTTCIHTMIFQLSFSGWVLRVSSQARTAISLAPRSSSTSTSRDQKHQHQYFPYLLGFSSWSKLQTCHVSPPSRVTSTRVTFFPPPS